ncbi:MAG: LysR family transcriptional regulator [Pseudomonadota bacterium]
MFDLHQLRCFVAVATELSFRRAAQRLHMTQSPLSRQIQMLERELGFLLFDRSGRSVQLTAAGRRFVIEAQDLLRRAEGAMIAARRAAQGAEGVVNVGFIPVASFDLLPRILSIISHHAPDVDLVFKEMSTVDQVTALPSGLIELGIMRPPAVEGELALTRIAREPFVLAVHEDHPFANGVQPAIEDLAGEDFVMYSPSVGWYGYQLLSRLFQAKDFTPNIVQHLGQTHTIVAMVNAGLGLALVPQTARTLGFPRVRLCTIDLPDFVRAETFLAAPQETAPSPACALVRSVISRELGGVSQSAG